MLLAARRKEVLEELAGEIGATGGTAVAVRTDVSDSGDVANLAAAAVGRHGGIDIWINNVGVGHSARSGTFRSKITPASWT